MTALAAHPVLATHDAVGESSRATVARAGGLGKRIDGREVLSSVDLTLRAGERVALLGANGAGKSTLLRVLATLTPPTSGSLELFGRPIGRDGSAVRGRIGLVGHQLMLYRDLSARENIEFFARLYAVPDPRTRAAELLEALGLGGRGEDAVSSLSRGMAQRVAIARALVHAPELLLADEPFTGVDASSAERLEGLLAGADNRCVLMATHDVHQALRMCARVVVLGDGRKLFDEPARGLREADLAPYLGGRAAP